MVRNKRKKAKAIAAAKKRAPETIRKSKAYFDKYQYHANSEAGLMGSRSTKPRLVYLEKREFELSKKARANANQRAKALRQADLVEPATASAIRSRFTVSEHILRINEFKAAQDLGEDYHNEDPFYMLSDEDILDENNVRCTAWAEGKNADEAVSTFIQTRKMDWEAFTKHHEGDWAPEADRGSGNIGVGDDIMNLDDVDATMTIGDILKEGMMIAAVDKAQETGEGLRGVGKSQDQQYPDVYDLGHIPQKLFFSLGRGSVQDMGHQGALSGG